MERFPLHREGLRLRARIMSRRLRSVLPAWVASFLTAAVCVVAPVVWWRTQLAASRAHNVVYFFNYDQYNYTFPAFRYAAVQLRHGRLPLWTPQQLCGGPFLATQLHGILYPLHWLIALLPLASVWPVLLLAHAVVAMSGAYVCARFFGVRRTAALLGGIVYAFSGKVTTVTTFSMEPALVSLAWLPWQLAFIRATLRSSHWVLAAIGLGVTSALCLLGGHLPYLPVAIVLCGVYAAMDLGWRALHSGLRFAVVRAARLCLAGAVAAGLAAVQILPTLDLARRSAFAGAFQSAQAADMISLAPARLLAGLSNSLPSRFGFADPCFMGVAAVGLALISLIDRDHWHRAAALWVLAFLVTLLALGTSTPVFGWYFHLQGGSIRLPSRFLADSVLCLALLSAFGADVLCRARRTLAILLAVLLLTAVPLILVAVTPAGLVAGNHRLAAGLALTRSHTVWVAAIGSVFLLPGSWSRRWLRPAALLAAAGLIAFELHGSMLLRIAIPATHPNALKIPEAAAAFVRAREGLERVVTPLYASRKMEAGQIPLRLGMLENLQAISDYEPLVDYRYASLMWTMSPSMAGPGDANLGPRMKEVTERALPLMRFLGVGFVIVPPTGGPQVRLPGPIYSDAQAAVYAVANPLPRAYVATDIRRASTPEQARRMLLGGLPWVLARGAIVEDPSLDVGGSDGSVEVRHYGAEEVELDADLSHPGLVVLEDRYDPYWRASVDGADVPILRTNYIFRGVAVGPGRHTIRFWYHPSLIYAGAAASLLTLCVLLIATVLWLRQLLTQWRARAAAPAIPAGQGPD